MSKIAVVGIGPGEYEQMTLRAIHALQQCDVIIGYTVYVDLVKEYFPGKEMMTTPMRREMERCSLAFEQAEAGRNVAMICSGDAGVYGMAVLILKLGQQHPAGAIEILPGGTAALSGAAVLGAPLIHDFCVISLSDLLTPWDLIVRRLEHACTADFSICLYNPSSHRRSDYLRKACDIMLQHKSPETVCGLVRSIGREGEEWRVLTLKQLRDTEVDMFTTVFIGNTQTKECGGRMVTPRGYEGE